MGGSVESGRDPLAPIEFVITCITAFLAVVFALTIPLAIFSNGSVFGIGDPEACAAVSTDAVPFGESDGPGGFLVDGLRPGARFFPDSLSICDTSPSVGVKAAAVTASSVDLLVLIGFLVVTGLLVRQARRHGLFSAPVAVHAGRIGWFLILGAVVAEVLKLIGSEIVVRSAVTGVGWADVVGRFDVPWTLVIAGVGVLTFSRVLGQAVALQDDVDATI